MVLDAEDLRGWAYSDTEVGEEHLLVGIPSEKAEAGLSNEDFKAGSVLGKHKFYEKSVRKTMSLMWSERVTGFCSNNHPRHHTQETTSQRFNIRNLSERK